MVESDVRSQAEIVVDPGENKLIRVLLVDDELGLLEVAKQCLEMQGPFHVDTAASVEEALKKLKKEKEYDAVVSDYQMPGKGGLEFLEELRKSGNSIPFVLFTGKGREEVAIRALNLGADRYLSKVGLPDAVYGELAYSVRDAVDKRRVLAKAVHEAMLMENVNDAIIGTDENFVVTSWNKAAEEMYGWQAEEVIGKTASDILKTEFVGTDRAKTIQTLRETGRFRAEVVQYRKDCRSVHVESTAIAIRNGKGVITEYVTVNRDVTERKQMEKQLKESEEKYRDLFENARDVIITSDLKGNVTSANKVIAEYGFKQDELVGKSMLKFVSKKYWPKLLTELEVLAQGRSIEGEIELDTPQGKKIVEYRSNPIKKQNRVTGFQGALRDITERKKAEEEIENLARFPSENPSPVLRIAKDGVILYANAAAKSMLGELKIEIGQPAPHQWRRLVSDALDSGLTKEVEVENEDRTFLLILTPVTNTAYVNVYGIDITERKKRAEELKESEAKYRVLFDNSLQGIAVAQGPAPHLIFVNAALSRIWGYTPEELTTLSPQGTTGLVHPEDQDIFFGCFRDRLEGKTTLSNYEFRGIRKDGTVVWLEQSATLIEYNGHPAVQATFIDVTERKKALERLRVLNEKMGVVGKLTRHDVRNKLSAVVGNTYLAKKTLPNDHKALDYLRKIESACVQTTGVLDFAAAYESLGVEGLTLVDVDRAVEEALSLISELKGVKAVNNCRGLTVMADSALRQLFFNLIENSLKHGKNVSQIKIHYEEGKDRLKLFYEDDGVGIPKADKPKLFAGGFTTGTDFGYGLSLIKSMMEIYGWTIEEEGEPGKGAKFVITIPKTHITMRACNTYL